MRVRTLLLFRLPNRALDVVLTSATAALLIWSRFALLADGPWEGDETLFARGILHFDLAAHFPHPPGFPGWLAIGHLLTPLTQDPLLALQLASAAFSVIALWLLAALGRRVAPPVLAVAAGLVVLAAPGPWLYAVRGFSTTAAAVLALGAAVVAVGGLEGRRVTAFSLFVTASFLVRPNLLPVLALLWAVVLLTAVAQLVWMQNRTTGRYATGVQMALAPLVAGAAATAPATAGCVGLLGLAAWLGYDSLPLVVEQHSTQFPAWIAVQEARSDALLSGRTVVLEPELYPFASYLWHLSERRGEPNPPWVLSPWDPGRWAGVDGAWIVATVHRHLYPGPLHGGERSWGGVSDRLRPLTQQRFLDAWVIEDPPLPLSGWYSGEREPSGRRFMWGDVEAVMALPPLDVGTQLGIALRPAPGPAPVVIEIGGREMALVEGEGGEQRLWLRIPPAVVDRVSELRFTRVAAFPPGNEDQRPLALQLYELRALSPGGGWAGNGIRLRNRGIRLTG